MCGTGGKSTQIAAAMQGKGLLVSNEIHPARAKILSENMERMGVKNVMVTNESPQTLAGMFTEYFDRIMVDAPCSGEGMFRKMNRRVRSGVLKMFRSVRRGSRKFLHVRLHAPAGRTYGLLYLYLCTGGNEGTISRFLEQHPQFHIVPVKNIREWQTV